MYILNNAIKNLIRNKVNSLFRVVIILLMVLSIAVSSIINLSVSIISQKYEKKLESEVSIKFDEKKIVQNDLIEPLIGYNALNLDDYLNFSKSKYVKKMSLIGNIVLYIDNDKYVSSNNKNLMYNNIAINCAVMGFTDKNKSLKYYNLDISKGSVFQKDNECIVSEDFLGVNKLKVGDTISLLSDYDTNVKLNLKIVGVYKKKDSSKVENAQDIDIYNNILTSYNTLVMFEKKIKPESKMIYTSASFLLRDSNSRKAFEKELRNKGLSDVYKVTIDELSYYKLITPIKHLSGVAFTSTLVILVLGVILLIISSTISIRKIKYDIGVLILIGMSKFKIIRSFIYESIIIILICIVLGLGIASILEKAISNYVFEYQYKYNVTYNDSLFNQGEYKDISINDFNTKQEMKNLKDKSTLNFMFKIIFIAMILILLTSTVSIYSTIMFQPIQIIYDRN
ncbi:MULTISPECIES: ABC transporter permease [unclassified Clostridioides]|uniref:ABC transporter permease n=1 Tax=unclassified Clostridioides TaxID=2635829 RepID=UPI001D11F5B5|nr:FtsX-like permease family protein [Clostridioides sp. ES-S-0171-01]MCC0688757.1 FtsX-like permease family protein [Clostridioides sp. ES-S-0056-01]MCC0716369.1 FtsX-like permease family protein [Clostridioides sp. ES-S-0077-01]UDN54093.1 FtsX-like permease family protein [Clostridioides sp. ES-S-0054-01]